MTRFFFDTRDGDELFEDREGVEFAEAAEAESAAIFALVSLARDEFRHPAGRSIEMRVRDDEGNPVLTTTLSLVVQRPNEAED